MNDKLYAEFGNGVSFATCAISDCVDDTELTPFFEGMRKFDPSIVTIHVSSLSPGGRWASKPKDGSVDHLLDDRAINNMAEEVVGILGPQDTDKAEPAGGWDAFERSLNKIYVMSLAEIKPSLLSASNYFDVGMKPPRL